MHEPLNHIEFFSKYQYISYLSKIEGFYLKRKTFRIINTMGDAEKYHMLLLILMNFY